jgi:MarR family transcriptional regulator, lower aerobic nicotinate degradation pathway regulator
MHDDHASNQPTWIRDTPSWLISQTALIAQRIVNDALAAEGARRYHVAVLSALAEFGPSSQVEIGRRCGIDRSDIAAVMNELEGQGLIERRRDPNERRRNIVSLTEAGQARHAQLDRIVVAAQEALLAPLARDERSDLAEMLGRIVVHHHQPELESRQE